MKLNKKTLIIFLPISLLFIAISFVVGYYFAGQNTTDTSLSSKYISTYQEEIPNLTSDLLLGTDSEDSSSMSVTTSSSSESSENKQGVIAEDNDRKVIKFDDTLSETEQVSIEEEYNVTFADEPSVAGIYVVYTNDESKVEELTSDNNVSVEVDKPVKLLAQTTDWGVTRIGADKTWSESTGSGVIVAVIDTGVQLDHPDLVGQITTGYDFINFDDQANDENGHGTHVSGIIAAANNGSGTVGASYSVQIMPLKVLNADGWGYLSDVAKAIYYAADHSARVVNMSLGSSSDSSVVKDAVRYAYNKGVLLVAAAGNDSGAPCNYPAAYEDVICVVATDQDNKIASFSNIGGELAAPGVSNYSTYLGSQYAYLSGTSMASPHVAASAALLFSTCSTCTNTEVRTAMRNSAADLGTTGLDSLFGYGLVDVFAATTSLLGPTESSSSTTSLSTSNTSTTSSISSTSSTSTHTSTSTSRPETPRYVDQSPTLYSPATDRQKNKIVVTEMIDIILEYGVTPESESTLLTKVELYLDDTKLSETTMQKDTFTLKLADLNNNQYIIRVSAYFNNGAVKKQTYVLDLSYLNLRQWHNDRANPDYPRNREVLGISSSFQY